LTVVVQLAGLATRTSVKFVIWAVALCIHSSKSSSCQGCPITLCALTCVGPAPRADSGQCLCHPSVISGIRMLSFIVGPQLLHHVLRPSQLFKFISVSDLRKPGATWQLLRRGTDLETVANRWATPVANRKTQHASAFFVNKQKRRDDCNVRLRHVGQETGVPTR
jgi:hypothetical protein